MDLFLRLLAAHACGDVLTVLPFASRAKRAARWGPRLAGTGLHSLTHGAWTVAWLWPVHAAAPMRVAAWVMAAHFLIDLARGTIEGMWIRRGSYLLPSRRQVLAMIRRGMRDELRTDERDGFRRWLASSLGDQALHLATLAIIASIHHP